MEGVKNGAELDDITTPGFVAIDSCERVSTIPGTAAKKHLCPLVGSLSVTENCQDDGLHCRRCILERDRRGPQRQVKPGKYTVVILVSVQTLAIVVDAVREGTDEAILSILLELDKRGELLLDSPVGGATYPEEMTDGEK